MTIEREEKWYESLYKGDTFIPFAIRLIETSRYIGEISIAAVNWQARHCWVGIVIGNTQHRGKGYGTDAMRVLLRYAFMEMNMNRVGLGVFGYNKQAVKSYEKVGFKHEGVARQAVWRDGRFYDDITMSILRDEWQQG